MRVKAEREYSRWMLRRCRCVPGENRPALIPSRQATYGRRIALDHQRYNEPTTDRMLNSSGIPARVGAYRHHSCQANRVIVSFSRPRCQTVSTRYSPLYFARLLVFVNPMKRVCRPGLQPVAFCRCTRGQFRSVKESHRIYGKSACELQFRFPALHPKIIKQLLQTIEEADQARPQSDSSS